MKKTFNIALLVCFVTPIIAMEKGGWEGQTYEEISAKFQYRAGQKDIEKFHLEDQNISTGMRIVSLGCGTGRLERDIARMAPGATVVCVEPSESMVAFGEQEKSDLNNLQFVQKGSEEYVGDEDADIIFSYASRLWVPEDKHSTVFYKVAKTLKRGGAFNLRTAGATKYENKLAKAIAKTALLQEWKPFVDKELKKKLPYLKDKPQIKAAVESLLNNVENTPSDQAIAILEKVLSSSSIMQITQKKIEEMAIDADLKVSQCKEKTLKYEFSNKEEFAIWAGYLMDQQNLEKIFGEEGAKRYKSAVLETYFADCEFNNNGSFVHKVPVIELIAHKE